MRGDDAVFGQFLIDAGLVSRSQLASLQTGDAPLSQALIDSGVMGEDDVRRAYAHALGVPFVTVEPHDIPTDTLVLIPEPLSRARGVIAFSHDDRRINVALLNLADLDALAPLQAAAHFGGRSLVPHLTTRHTVTRALQKYQNHLREKFGEMLSGGLHMAEALIQHAIYSRAGGAHVDISTHGALVRYQLGHVLHEAMRLPTQAGKTLAAQLKTLAKVLPVARAQEGRFRVEKGGDATHVQLFVTPTVDGEKISMRFAKAADGARGHTLEALGFHGENLSAVRHALSRRSGVVVVHGPEGAGKTTLLYTLLDMLQSPGTSLASVEPEVEYRLPHVAQTEAANGVSVAAALRATLKQHPDVLMVGNVESAEVASICAAAVARGVFVLAGTTQPNLLPQANLRIEVALARKLATNQFVHATQLSRAQSDTLEQRADFRKVYDALKEEMVLDADAAWKDIGFAHPTASTGHTEGYKGHIGIQGVEAAGFETLTIVEDALFKAAQGLTSVEEALSLAGK